MPSARLVRRHWLTLSNCVEETTLDALAGVFAAGSTPPYVEVFTASDNVQLSVDTPPHSSYILSLPLPADRCACLEDISHHPKTLSKYLWRRRDLFSAHAFSFCYT